MNLKKLDDIASRLCDSKGWSEPRYIDNGASAAVYAVDTPQGKAALKIYDPAFFEGENALIEAKRIELQTQLKNHGCKELIEVLDAAELVEDGTWYLVMEFCPWPSLEKRLSLVPDEKIAGLIKQLTRAVKFLDSHDLVHRDIKPANIVVSEDFSELKLLDFGVLRKVAFDEGSGTDGRKFIATAQYSPPEFLLREEKFGRFGFNAINIYQIGAVLHDLITKSPIFLEEKSTKNKFILYKAVTEKKPRIVSDTVPPRLVALCLAALDKDPTKRGASVALDDFLADCDDVNSLRRRLAGGLHSRGAKVGKPLLSAWEARVRSWGKEAAQLEAETLGAVTMKRVPYADGIRWTLNFKGAAAPIYLDMRREGDNISVCVLGSAHAGHSPAIITIDSSGANLPETGIPGVLAAQYLFTLDRALTDLASNSTAME